MQRCESRRIRSLTRAVCGLPRPGHRSCVLARAESSSTFSLRALWTSACLRPSLLPLSIEFARTGRQLPRAPHDHDNFEPKVQGFTMKSIHPKKSTLCASAFAAIAFLSSAWSGAAQAHATLGGEAAGTWINTGGVITRSSAKSATWGKGWDRCRASHPATRSIYVTNWSVQREERSRRFVLVEFGCFDSSRPPADRGPARL